MSYMIIEYAPALLDNDNFVPVRMDGHYAEREDADVIADDWAVESKNKGSRIVVVEIVYEAKEPDSWSRRRE